MYMYIIIYIYIYICRMKLVLTSAKNYYPRRRRMGGGPRGGGSDRETGQPRPGRAARRHDDERALRNETIAPFIASHSYNSYPLLFITNHSYLLL